MVLDRSYMMQWLQQRSNTAAAVSADYGKPVDFPPFLLINVDVFRTGRRYQLAEQKNLSSAQWLVSHYETLG